MIEEEKKSQLESEKLPKLSFGWIERNLNGMPGYVLVITISPKLPEDQAKTMNDFGLEYLDIEKDPEYQAMLKMEKGFAIYVKKHLHTDLDYSQGFFTGFTVYETYNLVSSILEGLDPDNNFLAKDAINQLQAFKKMLTMGGIDWESIKIAMPELSDFDKLLSELEEMQNSKKID